MRVDKDDERSRLGCFFLHSHGPLERFTLDGIVQALKKKEEKKEKIEIVLSDAQVTTSDNK